MKASILFLLAIIVIVNAAVLDVNLDGFGQKGVLPTQANGTVSEQISYMASIRLLSEEVNGGFGFGHFCAGVFISRQHILTLASCLSRSSLITPDELQIVAGTRYRYDESDAKILPVRKFELHPDYLVTDIPNNLAIIFLQEPVSMDVVSIDSIPIGNKSATEKENLQIFGWGTPLISNGPRELHTGRITIVDRNICLRTYVHRLCAGPTYYGGCQGDDGGAVVSSRFLFGLIDYRSSEYCSNERPAHLYVDVVPYQDWISETINNKSSRTKLSLLLFTLVVLASFIN